MNSHLDDALRHHLAVDRHLEAEEADIQEVRRRTRRKFSSNVRIRSAGWLTVALVGAGGLMVSPAGAALSDVASNFAGYLSGQDESAPGTFVSAEDMPSGFGIADGDIQQRRLLAQAGDYRLYSARDDDGTTRFAFNGAQWMADESSWDDLLSEAPIFLLGAPMTQDAEATGQRPMFGLAAGDVDHVVVRYEDGAEVTADASSGAFVLVLRTDAELRQIVAIDAGSTELYSEQLEEYNDHSG